MKKITILGPTTADPSKSMKIYPLNLSETLQKNFTMDYFELVQPKTCPLPFVKDIIKKEISYPLSLQTKKSDIYHISDHSYGSLAYCLPKSKTICTVHDLNALELARQSSFFGKLRFIYNVKALKHCSILIADSNYTKNLILKHRLFNGPIEVIYLGINKNIYKEKLGKKILRKRLNLPYNKKILLHVGHSNAVKNMETIIETLNKLPKDFILIKIGPFNANIDKKIARLSLKNRIVQFQNLEDHKLRAYYNTADYLVFPSFYEGFGLPVVEAMTCGLPVICSNTGALSETGGSAAYYIDTNNDNSLYRAIINLDKNENQKTKMIKLGYEQAKKFSWDKTAKETYKVYEEIYKKNN